MQKQKATKSQDYYTEKTLQFSRKMHNEPTRIV